MFRCCKRKVLGPKGKIDIQEKIKGPSDTTA